MPRPREIIDAADVLNGLSDETLDRFLSPKAAAAVKARTHAAELTERERVEDIMHSPHRDARDEQNYGRPTEASGRGAAELSRRSSTPVSGQADETSALGAALERGLSELEKSIGEIRSMIARARNQDTFPRGASGKNGGAEEEPEEEEEREKAAKGAPDFRAAAGNDSLTTLEMSVREVFDLLMAGPVAKSGVAMAKARAATADEHLSGAHRMMAANLLQHLEAAKLGAFPLRRALGELANQPGPVVDAILRALHS